MALHVQPSFNKYSTAQNISYRSYFLGWVVFLAPSRSLRIISNCSLVISLGYAFLILFTACFFLYYIPVFLICKDTEQALRNHGVPTKQLDIITPGGYYTVGNFEITARQGRHCQFDALLVVRTVLRYLKPGNLRHGLRLLRCNKEYPENGEILFYELKSGGKRLQIMGSMGLDGDTEYPTGADLLILPYQGKSKPEQYAASLVERLRPKAVLLDHYDNSFPPMTSRIRTAQFEKLLREKYKIPCRAMERGTTYDMEELTL